MAKPRQGRHDEVMLIPFLDILCALIGVLILIIIVLSTAQLQRAAGRTREEIHRARTYQELLKEKKELEKTLEARRAELAALQKRLQELTEKQKSLAEARKRFASSADEARAAQLKAAAIQKEIDELKAQIDPILKAMQPLQAEIEKLKQLLAEKKKKMDDKLASVVVRPSGSGSDEPAAVLHRGQRARHRGLPDQDPAAPRAHRQRGGRQGLQRLSGRGQGMPATPRSSSSSAATAGGPTSRPPAGPSRSSG